MLTQSQIQQLQGLPSYWRFALTGGGGDVKRCFEEGWNTPGRGHRLSQVLLINSSAFTRDDLWRQSTLVGVGVISGPESNGLLVIDCDGIGQEAADAFETHFKKSLSELPKTLANSSGKAGRCKLFFQVPPTWFDQLGKRSAVWRNTEGSIVLEAIWQNTTGTGRHAVIVGDHPDSTDEAPLAYHWMEGCTPQETGATEAPEWLLMGVLAQMELGANYGKPQLDEKLRSGEADATPWDRLTVRERRRLVEHALECCPNRVKAGGTYPQTRKILCGLLHEFGLKEALDIVHNSQWDTRNVWGANNNAEKTLRSLDASQVPEERKAKIASLFFLARESGWQPPNWALPPVDTTENINDLTKLINKAAVADDPVLLAAITGRVRREFGVDPAHFKRLVLEQALGRQTKPKAQSIEQISSQARTDNVYHDVIDGFLSRSVHVLAGSSHSGKTTLGCFLANRVVTGSGVQIDGVRHSVRAQGKVLIFTSDQSDLNMVRDLALEGIEGPEVGTRVMICSGTTFDDLLTIVRQLEEFAPDLVIYDCLSSMAQADTKIGDPSYADPIRLLVRQNGVAFPKCAHLILHHTSRDEPTRFSGSEQIKAASDELWIYYAPEQAKAKRGSPRPQLGPTRHLVFEKSRGGFAGRAVAVTRNAFQASWSLHELGSSTLTPLQLLSQRFRAVTHDRWQIASQWQRELDLEFNSRSLRRYLDQLTGTLLEKDRRLGVTGRNESHYRPLAPVRDAAVAMRGASQDGINDV